MKKRSTALLLALALSLLSLLSACNSAGKGESSGDMDLAAGSGAASSSVQEAADSSAAQETETAASSDTAAEEESSRNASSRQEASSQAAGSEPAKPTTSVSAGVQVEDTISTDEVIEDSKVSDIDSGSGIQTAHEAVKEEDYYQRSTLDAKQERIYSAIIGAVAESNNVVDLSALSVSDDEVSLVFQKVLADYPQYFFVSRNCLLVYGSTGKSVRALILLYTDGTMTDQFDKQMKLVQTADRELINSKIAALQAKVKSVIDTIDPNASDVLKERLIHDYVAETVTYDYQAADQADQYHITLPHAFDAYGAAVDGKAVCEGYAKLFQYLCYQVGINATQVIGTSNGGGHMWNTALIKDEWYQVDVTWDDGSDIVNYSYFNLTDAGISVDHTIDASAVSVPACTSDENSFVRVFAIYVADLQQPPSHYEEAIAFARQLGDRTLYLYIEGCEVDRTGAIRLQRYMPYLQRYLLRGDSDFARYLAGQGLSLSSTVSSLGEFILLSLIEQG